MIKLRTVKIDTIYRFDCRQKLKKIHKIPCGVIHIFLCKIIFISHSLSHLCPKLYFEYSFGQRNTDIAKKIACGAFYSFFVDYITHIQLRNVSLATLLQIGIKCKIFVFFSSLHLWYRHFFSHKRWFNRIEWAWLHLIVA